jgi:hypothetical protein
MSAELGVLLGQPGGTQSFEDVGSWALATAQCSLALQATDVHSSAQGLRLLVFSGAAGALRYDYLTANDALARLATDTASHRIVAQGWARLDTAAWSGQVTVAIGSATGAIPAAGALVPFRLETLVLSGALLRLEFRPGPALTGSGSLYLDDILVSADGVTLQAEWSLSRRRTLAVGRHGTLGGRDSVLVWGERPRLQAPLRYVPGSSADRIRGWWRSGWTLLFTLDSSDAEAQWPVRLGGSTAPLGTPSLPYPDRWEGALLGEGLAGGLDF